MTLHAAIEQVLLDAGTSMTTCHIADDINSAGLYVRGDRTPVPASQISVRIKNYSHIFVRSNGCVDLVARNARTGPEDPGLEVTSRAGDGVLVPRKAVATEGYDEVRQALLAEVNRRPAGTVEEFVPDLPGLYAIRIAEIGALPEPYRAYATRRNDRLVYVGKATASLRQRLVRQELRAKGHCTFFRSIGAMLGYQPVSGSPVESANKRNYTFSRDDNMAIVAWINTHLQVPWIPLVSGLDFIEWRLIRGLGPLLNLSGNPRALRELTELRQACVRCIARSLELLLVFATTTIRHGVVNLEHSPSMGFG
ncbi:GIY-YIG nuclease family protein [Arthrobacter rhombi]|uniref:GIY-YIG nuclease family protein n=1 Tax=Arthrobacter rhombi TaxID=71253 RepID=UPI003FCFB9AE